MGTEIERKFLVIGDEWRSHAVGKRYRQGYIPTDGATTVRVRTVGDQAFLTIKSPTQGLSRSEFEYPIPLADAETMLDTLCRRPLIEKTRFVLLDGELTWEIDEFYGDNQGLILAEVELQSEDQPINLPPWVGREVSHDARYFNSNLSRHPMSQWQDDHP
jgi:CYTH domain-containing protein